MEGRRKTRPAIQWALFTIWVFPCVSKNRGGSYPQNGWWILMENPMNKWMICGVFHGFPIFVETPISPFFRKSKLPGSAYTYDSMRSWTTPLDSQLRFFASYHELLGAPRRNGSLYYNEGDIFEITMKVFSGSYQKQMNLLAFYFFCLTSGGCRAKSTSLEKNAMKHANQKQRRFIVQCFP